MSDNEHGIRPYHGAGHIITPRGRLVVLLSLILLAYLGIMFGGFVAP